MQILKWRWVSILADPEAVFFWWSMLGQKQSAFAARGVPAALPSRSCAAEADSLACPAEAHGLGSETVRLRGYAASAGQPSPASVSEGWRPERDSRLVTSEISKGSGGLTVARHRGCADANAATQRTRRSPAATRVKSPARMISVDRTSGNEMSQSVAAACRLPRNPKNSALLFPRPMKTVCSIHFQ